MSERTAAEPQTLQQLPSRILDEVSRQFRSARNDVLRFGVWNSRNTTDEEFNHIEDRKLLGYFQQDLLETRFITKGRRVDIIQLWNWFDDQTRGIQPLLLDDEEIFLNIDDKDLEKVRKRMEELRSFFAILKSDDIEAFKRVKYKLRRTVLRLTYDLHHLTKRFDKFRKGPGAPRLSAVPLDPAAAAAVVLPEAEQPEHEPAGA